MAMEDFIDVFENGFIPVSFRYCSEDSFYFCLGGRVKLIDTSLKQITFAARTFYLLRCFIRRVNRAKRMKTSRFSMN